MKVIIAGPCGVGKSTIARLLAENANVTHIDFDNVRATDMQQRHGQASPCTVSKLDLRECIPLFLNPCVREFVLDIGGDTVFRRGADNEHRLEQTIWLKQTYGARIILLTADQAELSRRFLASKNRKREEFDTAWQDWKEIAEVYWRKCADVVIDTTRMCVDDWQKLPVGFPNSHLDYHITQCSSTNS